jgi:hypothetical protein
MHGQAFAQLTGQVEAMPQVIVRAVSEWRFLPQKRSDLGWSIPSPSCRALSGHIARGFGTGPVLLARL